MSEQAEGFGVTADDLRAYDWTAIIRRAAGTHIHHYSEVLFAEAKTLHEIGEKLGERVCRLLATVTAIPIDQAAVPPGLPLAVGRFSAEDLDSLIIVFPEIGDPELRAHIGDLIWECRKNRATRQIQRSAAEAYVLAARALEGEMWPPMIERLRRAMQLRAKLDASDPLRQEISDAVERMVNEHQGTETGLRCARLMELLVAFRIGDPILYASIAGVVALRLQLAKSFAFAREYWEVKARWHFLVQDQPAAMAARQAAAETYISEAEALAGQPNPSYMNVCGQMSQGVEALMRSQADSQRIEAVHKQLLRYQARQPGELHPMPDPREEMPELVQAEINITTRAREEVSGLDFEEAVRWLALRSLQLVNPAEVRRNEEQLCRDYPINYFVEVELFDTQGRIKGIRPAVSPWDAEQTEAAFTAAVFHSASLFHWGPTAAMQIEPARAQIEIEHAIAPRDMAFLVMDNPFVPADRAGLYARGLYAGFKDDLVLATHLLIPQIEHSIRSVLERTGAITSKLEDGIQDNYLLGSLLNREEVAAIFGPEIVFTLRGLLVERFGFNLRNDLCHGFATEQDLSSAGALYLWWFALHLCVRGPQLLVLQS